MKKYCENHLCDNRSIKQVPVSVDGPNDQVRAICAACQEAYTWGVQHGRMTVGEASVWILAVANAGVLDHVWMAKSKSEVEKGLVDYLHEYHGYEGKGKDVWRWLEEHNEKLSVQIVRQNINFGKLRYLRAISKAAESARTMSLFEKCDCIVLIHNRHDPNPDAPIEAWGYQGALNLPLAEPVAFGLGTDYVTAIEALYYHLTSRKTSRLGKG